MLENFIIVHHFGASSSDIDNPTSWIQWKTCMRVISLGFLEPLQETKITNSNSEILMGAKAYEFLLEVVCGLRSPIIGETEVMGQFKELVEKNFNSSSPQFKRLFSRILTDAKLVRENYLRDMGSRSYGSLLRRYLKEAKHITLLGAGHLAKEILPWLKIAPKLNVICRDLKKGKKTLGSFSFATVNNMSEDNFGDVFIVAAKIKTPELREFISHRPEITKIIDLRDTSHVDPLNLEVPTVTLNQLFGEIQSCEIAVEAKVNEAKTSIAGLSQKYFHAAELRPFGWEDLCG